MSESLGKAVLELATDNDQLNRGFDSAERKADTSAKGIGHRFKAGLQAAMVPALLVLGAVAVGLKKSASAAIEAEKSQARLQAQLKASGLSYRKYADEIDRSITKTSELSGLDDEDLQDAFTNIVRVTGDVNKSLRLTGLAADFARAKHMDVAKAGELVGKVAGGNVGILGRYGIQVRKGATATEALGLLQEKFAGQAKAYGDTTAGAIDRASVAGENLEEAIGKALAPALADLANRLLSVVQFLTKHSTATKIAIGVVTGLAAAVVAINVGMKLYAAGAAVVTAAQWLWNASLFAFPLVWIIAAIVAVIAIIVLAITHWDTIKAVILAAWDAIKSATIAAAQAVVGAIRAAWDAVKGATSAVWDAIKTAITTYLNAIKTAITTYVNAWKTVITTGWNAIKTATTTVWNAIKTFLSGAWSAIKSAVDGAMDSVVSLVKTGWQKAKDLAVTVVGNYIDFVRNIPERSVSALAGIVGGLSSKAREAWEAFKDATADKAGALMAYVGNIPDRIVHAIGNLGSLLYDEGRAIIEGLINGLKSKMGDLLGLVGGIAGKIKGLKGPIEKDRVLLVDEGAAIIDGLERGMTARLNGLLARVSNIAPTISQTVSQSAPSTAPAGHTGPLVNIEEMNVHDRFDESRFAADIGWRVQNA